MPKCACPHWDDVECLAIRYGLEPEDVHDGDACECRCHDRDEDGETEWEKDLRPAAQEVYYAGVPPRLSESLHHYFNEHIETGGFLRAVLENNLLRAVQVADGESFQALPFLISALLEYAPSRAWGSKEAVAAWLNQGGEA